jgi:hypothetical protein
MRLTDSWVPGDTVTTRGSRLQHVCFVRRSEMLGQLATVCRTGHFSSTNSPKVPSASAIVLAEFDSL